MYFGLSEEQQSFQEIIRKFLEDEATIDKIKLFNKGDLSDFPEALFKSSFSNFLIPWLLLE